MRGKDQSVFRIFLMLLIVGTNSAPFFLSVSIRGCCSSEILSASELPWGDWSAMWPIILGEPIDLLLFFNYTFGYSAVYVFLFMVGYSASGQLQGDGGLPKYLRRQYFHIYLPSLVLMSGLYIFHLFILRNNYSPFAFEEILLGSYHSGAKMLSSPSWFLTIVFCYYLLLPVIQLGLNSTLGTRFIKHRNPILILTVLITCFYVLNQVNVNHNISPFDFLIWVLLGHLLGDSIDNWGAKRTNSHQMQHSRLSIFIVFLISTVGIVIVFMSVIYAGTPQEVFRIYTSLTLLLCYFWNSKTNLTERSSKSRRYLREVSDSNLVIMLFHYPFIVLLLSSRVIYTLPFELAIALYFISTWLFSFVIQKYVIKRVNRLESYL